MKFPVAILTFGVLAALVLGAASAQEGGDPPPADPGKAKQPPARTTGGQKITKQFVATVNRKYEQRNFPEAKSGYAKIVQHPDYANDPDILYRLGICQLMVTPPDLDNAADNFRRVREADKDYALALYGLARTKIGAESKDEDIAAAKELLIGAIQGGVNVLGLIDDTPEFKNHKEIGSVQFTMQLLEAAKEFTFDPENRNDPFRIPREQVTSDEGDQQIWPLDKQKKWIEHVENTWKEAFAMIFAEDEATSNEGLDKYGELADEINRFRDKITFVELRLRMERVEEEMKAEWPKIKWKLLERLQREGLEILTSMNQMYKKKQYEEVMRMHEEELKPLAEKMISIDEDFIDVADDLLAQGESLYEDAKVGLEIQQLQIEVLGIVIADSKDVTLIDEFGKPTGAHERMTIILNQSEPPPELPEGQEVPREWTPPQRKYWEGRSIHGLDELVIQKIHRNKVECVYKEKYKIDLDLKKRDLDIE